MPPSYAGSWFSPTVDTFSERWSWATGSRVLDGLYVALAEQRDCPLLTTDARLAAAVPPCEVVLIPR